MRNTGEIVKITTDKDILIEDLSGLTEISRENDVKITIRATNNTEEDAEVALIVAMYDENNRFLNYVCLSTSIEVGDK